MQRRDVVEDFVSSRDGLVEEERSRGRRVGERNGEDLEGEEGVGRCHEEFIME